MPSVVELLLDAAAHLETEVRRYCHVAGVEQAMDVAPQQQAVARLVVAAVAKGADVSGFERRQRAFLRHGAASLVDVRHQHTESTLPQAWPDEVRLSEACGCLGHCRKLLPIEAFVDGLPKRQALGVVRVVDLERDDVR